MAGVWAADYPPLCIEISEEHPLFLFQVTSPESGGAAAYAQRVVQSWADLPYELKPFSVLQIDVAGTAPSSRHPQFQEMLRILQAADVPTVVRVADSEPRRVYPPALVEEILRDFTCVKGIQAVDLSFDEYFEFGEYDALGAPPNVTWLIAAIEVSARYGRFVAVELDGVGWPRVMTSKWCKPLYEKIASCAPYVIPINAYRGWQNLTQLSALLGMRLEGAAAHWGVGPRSWWYMDARCLEPGVFGVSDAPTKMPPSLYRAMILNGAMMGAAAYSFAPDSDLWFGPAQHHWVEAIYPTLTEILDKRFIARQDFVQKKVKVAYQLAAAGTSEEFHLNLRDIDPVFDQGFLVQGAYGMEQPGLISELVPNTGRYYWIPFFSPYAGEGVLAQYSLIVRPGQMASAQSWTELLNRYYEPEGAGTAFISRAGRGVFVLNTRENTIEEQTARIEALPAPVRGFEARYGDNGIEITWPFREGDVSYRVYKRVLPAPYFTLVGNDVDERRFVDAQVAPDVTVAYAVTALTSEVEPYERAVHPGEYLVFSVVESRIAEEVTVSPLLGYAKSQPIDELPQPQPAPRSLRPDLDGLTDQQYPLAQAVMERVEAWGRAFREENLNAMLDLYSTEYEDPQGWRFQYVRRAYQWFFERYNACTMAYQMRRWDFGAYEASREIGLLLYCRFEGEAATDPTGRFADVTAHFPLSADSETWVIFTDREGPWRIIRTDPPLPSFRDILSFSAAPYDALAPGPDVR
jgi:hypothetical protein